MGQPAGGESKREEGGDGAFVTTDGDGDRLILKRKTSWDGGPTARSYEATRLRESASHACLAARSAGRGSCATPMRRRMSSTPA